MTKISTPNTLSARPAALKTSDAGIAVFIKLFMTAVFWGGTFIAGRIISRETGPFTAAFLRFAIASVALVFLTYRFEEGLPRLNPRQTGLAVLCGLSGVLLYNACFFQGLKTVPAGRAAVIIAGNPIFLFIFSALLFGEPVTKKRILGLLLSVSGAVVAITHGRPWTIFSGGLGWGELFILGCVASWVFYSLVGRQIMKTVRPMAAVTYSCLIGAVGLFPLAWMEAPPSGWRAISYNGWAALIYLGLLGSAVGFTWYYQGIKILEPARAGVFINFVPISAIIMAWLILNETVDLSLIMGAALVITGVVLVNRRVPSR